MRSGFMSGAAVACLLGLSACGNNNTRTEAPAAEGSKAAPGVIGAALDAPRPGLWRITTVMEGAAGEATLPTQEHCVKEARLEPPANARQPGADCTTQAFVRQGAAMVAATSCALPGDMKMDSTIRVTGDFSSRYVTEVTTKLTPPPTPQTAQTKMTLTAERIGDCPAD